LFCAGIMQAQNNLSGIQLRKSTDYTQLLVDGKPFIVLGGELGNSTASNLSYLRNYWHRLEQMNLNTVLLPVYWELIEPQEGQFDFSLLDSTITDARTHNLKLALLWFGTWKNSMSCYAPAWMKTNTKRFPRTLDSTARSQEIFSVFGKETLEADKKAFAALMRHIREIDAQQKTILMVQVENEIAMLSTAREHSKMADAVFNTKLPAELTAYLQKNKNKLVPEFRQKWEKQGYKQNDTWANTFGTDIYTDEIFQAWHYAKYTNEVAKAGKKEYDVPMFVNAALPRPGKLPGQYPSAGPLPHLMDVWQAGAPALDMLSPDFYNPNTKYWCDLYVRNDNRLFVPEMRFDKTCAAKAFYILGHYKAIGFSPFSIEEENDAAISLSKSYKILQQLLPFIAEKKWQNMDGYLFDKQEKKSNSIMGKYKLDISHYNTMSWASEAKDSVWTNTGGIVLQIAPDEFLVAGTGIVVVFDNIDKNFVTNIIAADEVSYPNGVEVKGRRMNGDEDHQGRHVRFPTGEWGIQKIKLYNSPAVVD
jgi:beta-galactosidase GanA